MATSYQNDLRLRTAVFTLSLVAWLVMLWPGPAAPAGANNPGYHTVTYCGSAGAFPVSYALPGPALPTATAVPALTWGWASGWGVMLVAMMLPTLVPPLSHVYSRSFVQRRAQAIGLFLVGYGTVWLGVGVLLLALQALAQYAAPNVYLRVAGAVLLALGWQVSPLKQRCLNRGHRHPALAAFGWRAEWDALRLGLEHGAWCAASCWALMLLPLLLPYGHVWAMALVGLLMFCERLDPPAQPAWRWRGFKTAIGYGRLRLLGARSNSYSLLAQR